MNDYRGFRSNFSQRIFWPDGPPHVEHEYIAYLNNIEYNTANLKESIDDNFSKLSDALYLSSDNASSKFSEAFDRLADELDDERFEQELRHAEHMDAVNRSNALLGDISSKIDGVTHAVYYSGRETVETLNKINSTLFDIDIKIQAVSETLNEINKQMEEIDRKLSLPNEIKALEITNQVRMNLALKKKEIALTGIKEAMRLTNETSIIVMAYYILVLSLFREKKYIDELIKYYGNYVDIVIFRLNDSQSDNKRIKMEIYNTLYPVLNAVRYYDTRMVLAKTQALYYSLYNFVSDSMINSLLKLPLVDEKALNSIITPNSLRELHLTMLLKKYVIAQKAPTGHAKMLSYLDFFIIAFASNSPIANELIFIALEDFVKEGYLFRALKYYLKNNASDTCKTALRLIYGFLPQDQIDLNMQTLILLKKYNDKEFGSFDRFKRQYDKARSLIEIKLDAEYISFFNRYCKEFDERGGKQFREFKQTINNLRQSYKKKLEAQKAINDRVKKKYTLEAMNTAKEKSLHGGKIGTFIYELAPLAQIAGGVLGLVVAAKTPMFLGLSINPTPDMGFFEALLGLIIRLIILFVKWYGFPVMGSRAGKYLFEKIGKNIEKTLRASATKQYNDIYSHRHGLVNIIDLQEQLFEDYKAILSRQIEEIYYLKSIFEEKLEQKLEGIAKGMTPKYRSYFYESKNMFEDCVKYIQDDILNPFLDNKKPSDLSHCISWWNEYIKIGNSSYGKMLDVNYDK